MRRCSSSRIGQLPPLVGVPLGIVVSLAVAVVIGMPTFRLQGHYFSMATIAVAELIRIVVGNWDFVGAAVGLHGAGRSRALRQPDLPQRRAVLLHLPRGARGAARRDLGRSRAAAWAITGARSAPSERAARSLGVPVRRYKLYALMLSAGFTSLAGSLYALMVGFIDPDSGFGILVSVEMIITAALGGIGTLARAACSAPRSWCRSGPRPTASSAAAARA